MSTSFQINTEHINGTGRKELQRRFYGGLSPLSLHETYDRGTGNPEETGKPGMLHSMGYKELDMIKRLN